MEGWIKLHRKLLENPIFLNSDLLQLFIYCLLKANHEARQIIFNGKLITIQRGQFITGREVLSKELKQKPTTTYKRLLLLENLEFLNIKSNNKFSLVTVVNYDLYQSNDEESNSKSNNKITTKEQQNNTNKNDKNDKNIIISEAPEKFFNDNFGMITPMVAQSIAHWIDDGVEEALIIELMKLSISMNIRNWAYVNKAIKNNFDINIKTLEQYQAHEAERKRSKEQKPQYQQYPQKKSRCQMIDEAFDQLEKEGAFDKYETS